MTEILPIILQQYQEEKKVSFPYDATYTQVGKPGLPFDEDSYETVERDGDGNIIKTVRKVDDNTLETCTYDKNGVITAKISEYQNDKITIEEYFDQNMLTKRASIKPSETRTEAFDADGSHVDRIYKSSGRVRIETWGADGSLTVTYE